MDTFQKNADIASFDAMMREAKRISIIAKSRIKLAQELLEKNNDFPEYLCKKILDVNISPETLVEEEKRRFLEEKRKERENSIKV